ncbi:DUF3068 domain-containing protein [Micromonospora sp. NPDC049903]|uniref:DUF3068 domain-containing protein n=1 Tax=Micromonospora sp. NPDC049903 TaxID=3364276 RepID=UPI0037921174
MTRQSSGEPARQVGSALTVTPGDRSFVGGSAALRRKTNQPITSAVRGMRPSSDSVPPFWPVFPFHSDQTDYEVFDRDLRQTRVAEFKGTEDIDGLEAYRYEQVITDEKLPLPADRVGLLLGALAPGSTSGDVVYSNIRTVWVDPVTGSYLKVREQQKKVLVPNAGAQVTLLDADFSYNDETVAASVERAKESRGQLTILGVYAPLGLAVLGVAMILVGLLVSRDRGRSGPTGRHAATSAPTRVDQPAVRDDQRQSGPLSDEIPPASTNWKSDEPTVPGQRSARSESDKN